MMGCAKAHYDGIVAFSQTDFAEDLKKLSVPVIVIHSEDDITVRRTSIMPTIPKVWFDCDLPPKALVWQDAAGETLISYNEPSWIAQRHGIANAERVVNGMSAALSGIVRAAVASH
jgi:hypothetical protein